MAGLGRRTHYRKHLTDSVLHDLPEPKDDERIAKVVSTRGGNHFDIVLALSSGTKTTSSSNEFDRTPQLAILPTKFHKLVWVKRNDYVIVQTGMLEEEVVEGDDHSDDKIESSNGDEHDDGTKEARSVSKEVDRHQGGIRYIVTHILYKDQVKHLRSKGLWPEDDPEFEGTVVQPLQTDHEEEEENEDGIVYNEYDNENDDDLFINTNRIGRLEIQDSGEEDSSDEED